MKKNSLASDRPRAFLSLGMLKGVAMHNEPKRLTPPCAAASTASTYGSGHEYAGSRALRHRPSWPGPRSLHPIGFGPEALVGHALPGCSGGAAR